MQARLSELEARDNNVDCGGMRGIVRGRVMHMYMRACPWRSRTCPVRGMTHTRSLRPAVGRFGVNMHARCYV